MTSQDSGTETKPVVGVIGMSSRHAGGDVASSSGSNLRSNFIGMGFSPFLVDKAIQETGEENVDLLLEALIEYSAIQKSSSESSDLDGLFGDCKDVTSREFASVCHPEKALQIPKSESSDSLDDLFGDNKDKPIAHGEVHGEKKASLLNMNFAVDEVDFAIDKLGEGAPVNDLVDFIIAAQIAKNETDSPTLGSEEKIEEVTNETLFGTMDKTLRLIEMGFSEHEISAAIEKFGSEVPIQDLADSICAGQLADRGVKKEEDWSTYPHASYSHAANDSSFLGMGRQAGAKHPLFASSGIKTEEDDLDGFPQPRDTDFDEYRKGKMPKQEYEDDSSSCAGPTWLETRNRKSKMERLDRFGFSKLSKSNPCKSVDQMVSKPPYFVYGNVVNLSHESWAKISQFLYALEPEFVNTQFFSALSRKEGYVHNLPTKNRSHILPKPPMTIEDSIPHTKKWWPSWDTRKQLSSISSETSGISQQCDRLGKILIRSQGLLSAEQQTDILHNCRAMNLLWVGPHQLGPIEPEQLEQILGYPKHHTQAAEFSLIERLQALKNCFQTDTLGYHISVLKSMFPEGLTMLSIHSGIGGAEITLHRLGIHLKSVISVEGNETNRKILRRWWQKTGQTGELVQIEDIHKLNSTKLESLIHKFGGFDFIICQNPCANSFKISKLANDSDSLAGFDFSIFYEFVRVLQRVRSSSVYR